MASGWLRWTFTAAMIFVVMFHARRLVKGRLRCPSGGVDVELTHAAMGAVMVVMLVTPPSPAGSLPLAAACSAPLLWFLWRGTHGYIMDGPAALGVHVRQVVGCAAMVYLLIAVSAGGSAMAGMSMAGPPGSSGVGSPLLTGVLLAATIGAAVWTLSRQRRVGLTPTPMLAAGCSLAMNATTVYMQLAL